MGDGTWLDSGGARLLRGERFHLLGMSQGGRVAARYAVSRPERLRSLILQGPAVDGDEPERFNAAVMEFCSAVDVSGTGAED